jgi:hypothetical protein|tara:strand:+ start:53 stop:1024 length:972 start_codon:yes stop_codon:yes gene_type:complete
MGASAPFLLMGVPRKDLSGQRFGMLTTIAGPFPRRTPSGQLKTQWEFRCDCGNVIRRDQQCVTSGRTTHCGCSPKRAWESRFYEDLTGKVIGRLTVLEEFGIKKNPSGYSSRYWTCRCECGKVKEVAAARLISRKTLSCGCLVPERTREASFKHGLGKLPDGKVRPEYQSWRGMKNRCLNKNFRRYDDWGGRGIKICPEWVDDFQAFYDYMGPKPSPDMSIDRIDNNGDYEPGNVRWATVAQQNSNQRPRRKKPKLPKDSDKSMNDSLERPIPEAVTTVLEEGCISITVGDLTGVVSSMHLIQPKVHQLQKAWLEREQKRAEA